MTDAQAVAWHVSGEGFDGDEFFTLSRRIGEHFQGAPLYPASVVEALRAEIAALRAGSQVPEGWKLVPIKSLDKMEHAAVAVMVSGGRNQYIARKVWDAMLAASPTGGTNDQA